MSKITPWFYQIISLFSSLKPKLFNSALILPRAKMKFALSKPAFPGLFCLFLYEVRRWPVPESEYQLGESSWQGTNPCKRGGGWPGFGFFAEVFYRSRQARGALTKKLCILSKAHFSRSNGVWQGPRHAGLLG